MVKCAVELFGRLELMGNFVNPDSSLFQVAFNSEIYVDKSGIIKFTNRVMNTKQGYICNTRPRRFGKSTTADMLAAYYSRGADSESLFSSLEIGRDPSFREYLNKYDVIRMDIQWAVDPAGGRDKVVSFISDSVIKELREYYPESVGADCISLSLAMNRVSRETGRKFVVIIDEWDVLIRDDNDKSTQKEYIDFLRSLFKGAEATGYIALAYLTGILPIVKEKTQSALNNFDEYTMLNPGPFAPYFGFTDKEVRTLAEKYNEDYSKVERWYDGYILKGQHVYNPKAVVSVMLTGEYTSYWTKTASYEVVIPLINLNYDGLKDALIEMLGGKEYPVDTSTFQNDPAKIDGKDDVITYLIHLGYLAYNSEMESAFIPNEEIRQELWTAVMRSGSHDILEFIKKSDALLEATIRGESSTVSSYVEDIHMRYTPLIRYNDENSLASVISIAYLSSMQYYQTPIREFPSGKGYADCVYLPKPRYSFTHPALVIELKWDRSAEGAISQIKEKKYPDSIKGYTENILLVGINYDKKTKEHECLIERLGE